MAGYTFAGWFVAVSGGSALSSPYTLAGSTTLYAQWAANATDTVTFNSEGGSAVGSLSGLDGTTITLPAAPTLAGYTFAGWFVAVSGGSALSRPTPRPGRPPYAQWAANATDTVTFNRRQRGWGSLSTGRHHDRRPAAPTLAGHLRRLVRRGEAGQRASFVLHPGRVDHPYAQWAANATDVLYTGVPPAPASTAVGDYVNSGGHLQTLTEKWNGKSWSLVSQPTPTATGQPMYSPA